MLRFTIPFIFLLTLCLSVNAQNEPNLTELLSRLQENHMGSIQEVFNEEELQILQQHFYGNQVPTQTESILRRRGASTQDVVTPVQVVEINPLDVSEILPLGPSSLSEFEGAGVVQTSNQRSVIVDNGNRIWLRGLGTNNYTDSGINVVTENSESITGLEAMPNGVIYGIGTNGSTSSHLYRIDPSNWSTTTIGGNNNLILPLSLARTGTGALIVLDGDDDNMYELDMTTGSTSLLGSVGFDANFGQGMGYDLDAKQVLMTAFNNSTFASELRAVDPTSGLSTLIGTITPGLLDQFGWVGWYDADSLSLPSNVLASVTVFPNPVSDVLQVKANGPIERYAIFNVLGQKLTEQLIHINEFRIPVSNLSTGLYILQLYSGGQRSQVKFSKQ